jgi:hypothetical protein
MAARIKAGLVILNSPESRGHRMAPYPSVAHTVIVCHRAKLFSSGLYTCICESLHTDKYGKMLQQAADR